MGIVMREFLVDCLVLIGVFFVVVSGVGVVFVGCVSWLLCMRLMKMFLSVGLCWMRVFRVMLVFVVMVLIVLVFLLWIVSFECSILMLKFVVVRVMVSVLWFVVFMMMDLLFGLVSVLMLLVRSSCFFDRMSMLLVICLILFSMCDDMSMVCFLLVRWCIRRCIYWMFLGLSLLVGLLKMRVFGLLRSVWVMFSCWCILSEKLLMWELFLFLSLIRERILLMCVSGMLFVFVVMVSWCLVVWCGW